MPKTLTLAQVARLARKTDPAAWDALSAEERQAMVDRLNAEAAAQERHRASLAAFDRNVEILKRAGRRRQD